MSQSILLTAQFKNNKFRSVGLFNPVNNRAANENEIKHFYDMIYKHIIPVEAKIKNQFITVYTQNGLKHNCNSVLESLELLSNDK